ncbi:probable LRR receptor-like serine/threonine-protein kinase At1g63430 [Phragmites australis]|uniref:probable LRR receptor-like serine/threonine-protein kinase At1g63430 n=1 Tax=Phragmites australis TaxID=29695 RepID=UPI002D7889EC|nr:probable LRR receptor-like serine/threonine-protein kinase At1g63430 [Phragmites australis]XP_062226262.1 probable LRR receptor-like serine/threonine-protein kinase At1g63430 [Phragmites australis]XP_062226263.1 probable LRR receptor-like serine/threonine-protein kinase At1g63430 [Phragmites australis]XP_062226264.1 probable LRR receptor-like serine/threonine-protein kinase At1g63430 [Phragmites australis]XP_062226265.1 probable LRR receptor-like serine/threonine-protein kinase At1g63430 [Ph
MSTVKLLGISLLRMLLVAASASVSDDVSALLAFKRAIYEDPLSKLSDWNSKDKDPCTWSGVGCSAFNSRVVTLELSNSSLQGFLAPEIGSLRSLQKLMLDHNTFMGSIPKEIGMLKNLTELDLGTNQLAGPIPSEIGDMPKITKIDLHGNRLKGAIPPELGKLASLVELRLSNNSLTGIIPSNDSSMEFANSTDQIGLCQLSQLTDIDLSYNFLAGDIPMCLKQIQRSSLVGNCFQNNGTVNRPVQECQSSQDAGEDNHGGNEQKGLLEPLWLLILGVVAAVSLLCLLTLCTITGLKRCRARSSRSGNNVPWTRAVSWKENTVISIDDDLLGNVPKISRQELAEACEDFSNIIGSSHETVVYKGTLKDGQEIAVVSLSVSVHYWNNHVELYFQKEVIEMARLGHENAAKMVGYCKESDPFSRMLAFQYPPNGTLYEHIHDGEGCQLTWPRRMKLALSIARVLRYLHTELQPPFAVAALTSSSVYLTEDFSPKILDFERWRYLVTKPGLGSGCPVNGGSVNNITDSRHKHFMDVQANTFAFGVILLELISSRAAVSKDTGDLVDWARKHLDQPKEFSKLVDPNQQSMNQESLGIVCNVVNLCIDPEPSRRPSMSMIAAILEEGIEASTATLFRDSSLAWAEAELAIS